MKTEIIQSLGTTEERLRKVTRQIQKTNIQYKARQNESYGDLFLEHQIKKDPAKHT